LRVLEAGEFMRVGSSKMIKTNVRVIAATNIDLVAAISNGRFREDLFFRLNTVPIVVPPLRKRGVDIHLLFRKFASDFAEKYRMPSISLTDDAIRTLENYEWPGNIRQLKNITEQISIIERERIISIETLQKYLPDYNRSKLPALMGSKKLDQDTFTNERELLYKILFDMKNDVNDLKKLVGDLMDKGVQGRDFHEDNAHIIKKIYSTADTLLTEEPAEALFIPKQDEGQIQDTEEIVEESLSLENKEIEMIRKALEKHQGKRKHAADDLGISERTLYRKIKEYNIE